MSSLEPHPAAADEALLLKDCQVRRQRRSGPGGQHRNKVETAIVITHVPSGIRGEASERRSQEQNRRKAIERLRVNLALGIRTKETWTAPGAVWRERCVGRRIQVNAEHEDFPALLADALDALAATEFDVQRAAQQLTCSTSQLVKFLQVEPRAFELLNQQRRDEGLRPLT